MAKVNRSACWPGLCPASAWPSARSILWPGSSRRNQQQQEGRKGGRQMAAGDPRQNKVHKAMNRPLTILGAERRLFFVALISGGAVFSLMHSLLGGILLFIVGVVIARIATKHDVEILRVLFNSAKFRRRYDPMQWEATAITVRSRNVQD